MELPDKDKYLGNRNLKRSGVAIEWDLNQLQEFQKCQDDVLYFINNYVKIVNIDLGLIPFKMWPFQEEMILTSVNNRFVIAKMPRQVGKTTTVAALLLWYVLFNESYSIALLAHKEKQAREILSRIQLAFEHLPKWLQQGVIQWNKGSLELENGSKIMASSTASTAIRGTAQNLIYLDEFAFVQNHLQEEFFQSVYPTISSGSTSKVIITSTPNGMEMFYKLWTDSEEGRNNYARVSVHWSDVPGRTPIWKQETIQNTSQRQFDQEFECEFLGSSNTLIDGKKLQELVYKTPILTTGHIDVYDAPDPKRRYLITVDTSRGVDIDYSAFIVFDITEIPYRVSAKFRANDISPLMYPDVIRQVGLHYNNAPVLVETNDIGQQVADILYQDLEYDNVLVTQSKGRAGQALSTGFGKTKPTLGIRTTKQVKRIGCGNFKTLVEQNRLIINDFDLLYEMCRFIEHNASYQAEEGQHDDLVMCCVLFSWLINQNYFKEMTDLDIRKNLMDESRRLVEDDVIPFLIDAGEPEMEEAKFNEGERIADDFSIF